MRTGTVSYKLEDLRKGVTIPIGMVGENDFTRVIFDSEEVFKKHPDAQVTMKVQPPKGGIYPAIVTRNENAVIWQVKAADVAHKGSGELQLTFTADTMVEKSYIARTDIKRSLVGNGPAPDPVQDWMDNAEEVLEDLEAAQVHQPTIGTDGYWYKWNQETGEYEKTDTKAQGADGHSPVLTSSKSGKTTTIYSDGVQLAQIMDGEDGQSEKKEKFYQKFTNYDGTYQNLSELVPFNVYDEIIILIYQSDAESNAWSNTDWNAFFLQNENNSNVATASYLKGTVPNLIRFKRYKEVVIAEFADSTGKIAQTRVLTGNDEIVLKRIRIDAVSSSIKSGCTMEIYVF